MFQLLDHGLSRGPMLMSIGQACRWKYVYTYSLYDCGSAHVLAYDVVLCGPLLFTPIVQNLCLCMKNKHILGHV